MWYIYTMEYYSAIKKNKIGSFVETWMDLETVIQSEVKSEREKYHKSMKLNKLQLNNMNLKEIGRAHV